MNLNKYRNWLRLRICTENQIIQYGREVQQRQKPQIVVRELTYIKKYYFDKTILVVLN